MNALVNKLLCIGISMLALIAFPLSASAQFTAQLEEKALPVGEFSSVSVSDDFEITLSKGEYGVRLTVDKVLAPYVQVYVRSQTLYLDYDIKNVPKDVRQLYKGRGAPVPVFRAVVSLPQLNGISLSENASLSGTDEFAGSRVNISVSDKAQIKSLNFTAEQATLTLGKKAQAAMMISADDSIDIDSDGSATLQLSALAKSLSVNAAGQSSLAVSGDIKETVNVSSAGSSKVSVSCTPEKVIVNGNNSSDVILNGSAQKMVVQGDRSFELEASGFTVQELQISLNGASKVNATVEQICDVTLLGGSQLLYTGDPLFKIGKVVKSTLAPSGSTLK